MKTLYKIVLTLKMLRFSRPKKRKIVLLHNECRNIMDKTILHDFDYTILPASGEMFYACPQILFRTIKNWIRIYLFERNPGIFYCFYLSYLLSCLEYINPKVVLTFIDNSGFFWILSRRYDKSAFYAIQNGVKGRYDVKDWLPEAPYPGSVISMPDFICFGQHEIDLYRKYGHKIDRYHPVGSLIGGYFKSVVSPGKLEIKYDLCLVSQWRRSILHEGAYPDLKRGFIRLNELFSEFIKIDGEGISFCIATCSSDPEEVKFFKSIYGEKTKIIKFNRMELSTYRAMDQSRVILGMNSCAAWEAFGWGKKVLFCNFTGNDIHDFPCPGPWATSADDYTEFKKKLEYLLALREEEYRSIAREHARYVMNYNFERPAHIYIKEMIEKELKKDGTRS